MPEKMRIDSIVDFSTHNAAVEESAIALERMRSEIPCRTQTWNHYRDPSGQFFTGIWASSAGSFEVNYSEEELCVLLEGRVRLIDSSGQAREFGPGGAFVIPAGFTGVWENLEPVKKIYAIWQSPNVTSC
ncbi:MAG: cupin domain-containing protein [Gallionella sp.]